MAAAARDVDLHNHVVSSHKAASEQSLIQNADLIVFGRFDSADRQVATNRHISGGTLVNFVQTFHNRLILKGSAGALIRVLSTGIEPLPDADDPNNAVYPGPMAEG